MDQEILNQIWEIIKQLYEYYKIFRSTMRCCSLTLTVMFCLIKGLPLYYLCKEKNIENAFLSFFPIGDMYMMLKLNNRDYKMTKNMFFALFMTVFSIVYIWDVILDFFPFEASFWSPLLFVTLSLLKAKIYYDFINTFIKSKILSFLLAILSGFLPITLIIIIFVIYCKNNNYDNNI